MDTAILMLHSVGDPDLPSNVSPSELDRLIDEVASERPILPLPQALSWDEPTAALTFDDGYRNFLTEALPVLERHDAPATLFLPVDLCLGRWPQLPRERFDTKQNDFLLRPDDIERLARHSLVTLGNHTLSHPRLPEVEADAEAFDLDIEIRGARRALEEILDAEPRQFSYPFGAYDDRVVSKVAEAHDYAVTAEEGLADGDSSDLRLPRIRGEDVDAALERIR